MRQNNIIVHKIYVILNLKKIGIWNRVNNKIEIYRQLSLNKNRLNQQIELTNPLEQ